MADTLPATRVSCIVVDAVGGKKKKKVSRSAAAGAAAGRSMELVASLARRGLFAPSADKVERFLRTLAVALATEDVRAFETLHRKMPQMGAIPGFLVEVVPLVSCCLHSRNRIFVLGALDAIEEIVSKHGRRLSAFSVTRILNELLDFDKADGVTCGRVKGLLFKMIDVNHHYTLYPLERLMAVSSEELQMEIVYLMLERVMSTKRLKSVIVTDGCRIALEGLVSGSPRIRYACLDLIYALFYRGTPRDVLVRFFVKRNVADNLLSAVRARLRRRYKPPLLAMPGVQDDDFLWAESPEGLLLKPN